MVIDMQEYATYPVVPSVDNIYESPSIFPSVTICNFFRLFHTELQTLTNIYIYFTFERQPKRDQWQQERSSNLCK